ncbi:division plane positioning ATPase MipZ [Sphingobium sp. BS19]|uniref:division plane positioning ATPase MipZ n=1 Tax=Sphingobium sp. BS19 TaxID=3018973 RepID=UPI0022EEF819|nr:division plane positioning ATPase MipZ [Sphingobium sp. BS19]GLI97175.1 ATPase [Sphingobium sp. BS19]
MTSHKAHTIVFANEKGGTGKSTTAVHVAVALATQGHRVGMIDLDPRQRTVTRYMENRGETAKRRNIVLPAPEFAVFKGDTLEALAEEVAAVAQGKDFLMVDTPGRDDVFARAMASQAHTLVTPMNDSFVDFDLIGQVDAETFKVKRLSFYSELIFEARKSRAKADGVSIDWVVLRNRVQHHDARNKKRVGDALTELSRRVGFRVIPGLSERVIYRELFPSGLTLLDKGHLGELGVSHIAARQELREMVAGLALPSVVHEQEAASADAHNQEPLDAA